MWLNPQKSGVLLLHTISYGREEGKGWMEREYAPLGEVELSKRGQERGWGKFDDSKGQYTLQDGYPNTKKGSEKKIGLQSCKKWHLERSRC